MQEPFSEGSTTRVHRLAYAARDALAAFPRRPVLEDFEQLKLRKLGVPGPSVVLHHHDHCRIELEVRVTGRSAAPRLVVDAPEIEVEDVWVVGDWDGEWPPPNYSLRVVQEVPFGPGVRRQWDQLDSAEVARRYHLAEWCPLRRLLRALDPPPRSTNEFYLAARWARVFENAAEWVDRLHAARVLAELADERRREAELEEERLQAAADPYAEGDARAWARVGLFSPVTPDRQGANHSTVQDSGRAEVWRRRP